MLKCFGLVALLLFGVLLGIQKTHFEMNELKGSTDIGFVESINQNNAEDQKYAKPLYSSHDLKTKQETLAKVDSFNVFSALGKKLTASISSVFSVMISVLGTVIQGMLSVFSP